MCHGLPRRRLDMFHGLFVLAAALALGADISPVVRAAGTIFVRSDGSDTLCNGTANAPASSAPNCAFATVQKGVTSVDAGGTINVGAGTYNERVNIPKALTLRGANAGIDARAPTPRGAESIVNGGAISAPFAISANDVTIDGFQVQGGQNNLGAGIWMGVVSGVQILNNVITDNTIGLFIHGCPCTIRHNRFDANNRDGPAGHKAIYTEATNGLIVDANEFRNHTIDVPIVFATATAPAPSHTNLTFTGNTIHNNARLGIYVLGVSGATFSGNYFAGNSSASPTYGDITFDGSDSNINVVGNTFAADPLGVRVSLRVDGIYTYAVNSNINVSFNRFFGQATNGVQVINNYAGTLNAENNWWGCNGGPGAAGCDTIAGSVDANPWLTLKLTATPNSIFVGGKSTLSADLTINSNGVDTTALGHLTDGTQITFGGTLGSLAPASAGTLNGKAQSVYTAGATAGSASVTAQLDNAVVSTPLAINPKRASATTLTSSANPAVFGQTITFMATVSAIPAGTGTPTGTVTFKEGATILGASALNGLGQATLSTAQLSVGSHTITAFYGGNAGFNPSDNTAAPFSQTIAKANTTTTITADVPDPSPIGRAVTIQFSVIASAPGSGLPTGSVTVGAGSQSCMGALNGGAGSCNITLSSVGTKTLTATYSGDGNFNSSSGTANHEVVYFKIYVEAIAR